MSELQEIKTPKLNKPWLVAVWPGMGQVGMSAGYYLMSKLGMEGFAEFSANELFDADHVEVHGGIIQSAPLPRSRCFFWRDPKMNHDLVLFIGESQPVAGKQAFSRALISFAKNLGVERVYSFAAIATPMHPEHVSRVFGAATSPEMLSELTHVGIKVLEEGQIGGLNGVILGAASEAGLPSAALLGEMPHIFSQLLFPGACLAVLKKFSALADVSIDLDELIEQSDEWGNKLGQLLAQVQGKLEANQQPGETDQEQPYLEGQPYQEEVSDQETFEPEGPQNEVVEPEPLPEKKLSFENEQRLKKMFSDARIDRSKSVVLKQELDRLDVFREYEDQFLDLFRKPQI